MFVNRYLHKNIEQTHERRGEVKKLKEELAALQQKLEWLATLRNQLKNVYTRPLS